MSVQALQADCKKILDTLGHCTNDELDEIMNDDDRIQILIADLGQSYLQNLQSEKETISKSIDQLSELNLTKEPELVEGREKIEELSNEGEELTKIVEEKYNELRDKGGDMSLDTALALLQTAASEMEEESDAMAKGFLDNDKELEQFLDEFLTKRKLMHLRLVKAEKLSKIITQDPLGGGNYVNAPPLSVNSNYFPAIPAVNPASVPYPINPAQSNVPYPTGAFNMPMPGYFQNHY